MDETLTFRDLLRFYFRHQPKILTIFLVATVTVTGLVYYFPENYEVQAKLLVKVGRENASVSPAITNPQVWSIGKQMKEVMRSEVEILDSMYLAERLIAEVGVDFFDPPGLPPQTIVQHLKHIVRTIMGSVKGALLSIAYGLDIIREITPEEEMVLGFLKNLAVIPGTDSNVISLIYKTPDPDIGRAALDRFIAIYLDYRISIFTNTGVYAFFQEEVDRQRELRDEAASLLAEFKSRSDIASLEIQKEALLKQYLGRQKSRDDTWARLRELRTGIEAAELTRDHIARTEVVMSERRKSPKRVLYEAELVGLEAERSRLEQRYDDGFPLLSLVDREVSDLQKLIQSTEIDELSTVETGTNPVYKNLENRIVDGSIELAIAEARLESEEEILAEIKARLDQLNAHEVEYKHLSTEVEVVGDTYVLHKRKLEEARVNDALDTNRIANVSVTSPATSSIVPLVKMRFIPRKIYYIVLAMVASLGLGVGYALSLDYFDHTVRDERDAERILGVPTLGGFFESDDLASIVGPRDDPQES